MPKKLTRGLHRLGKLLRQSFGHYGFEINWKPKKTEVMVIWRGLTAKRERHLDPLRFGEPLTMAPPLTMAQKRSKVGQIFRLPCSGFAAQFRGTDDLRGGPFSDTFLGPTLTETCIGGHAPGRRQCSQGTGRNLPQLFHFWSRAQKRSRKGPREVSPWTAATWALVFGKLQAL